MSYLHKLSISGIRAFDNNDREVVQFTKPLTLITGLNGVGKTTIIEALRYATTGDLPPNSKGGAFIHDPAMSGNTEVLAQIKLAYVSASGKQMVCTRSMQLTVKKASQTFKTLEGQLLIISDNRKDTVSSRCADLEYQVPLSLGIAPAILKYVVFCHQEDSLWPLAEPSVVKKYFDEIFEATKYTKALESLKGLKKDYTAQTKLHEKTVQYLGTDYERAKKIIATVEELNNLIEVRESERSRAIDGCTMSESLLEKYSKKRTELMDELQKAKALLAKQAEVENMINLTSSGLEILNLDKTEVTKKLRDFDLELNDMLKKSEAVTLNLQDLESQFKSTEADLAGAQLRKNNLISDIRARDSLNERLEMELKQVEVSLKPILPEGVKLSTDNTHSVLSSLELELLSEHEKLRVANQHTINQAQQLVNNATADQLAVAREIHDIEDTIKATEEKIVETQAVLAESIELSSQSGGLSDKLDALREQKSDTQKRLSELHKNSNSSEIARLESLLAETQSELLKSVSQSEAQVENRQLVKQKVDLEGKIENLRISVMNEAAPLGLAVDSLNQGTFKSFCDTQEQAYTAATHAESEAKNKLMKAETEASLLKARLDDVKAEASRLSEIICSSVPGGLESPSDLRSAIKNAEQDVSVIEHNKEQARVIASFYQLAETTLENDSACLLCERPFTSSETASFEQLLREKKETFSADDEDDVEMREAQEKLKGFRAVEGKANVLADLLSNQIPILEEKLEPLEQTIATLASEASAAAKTESTLAASKAQLATLQNSYTMLEKLHDELSEVNIKLDRVATSALESGSVDASEIRKVYEGYAKEFEQAKLVASENLTLTRAEEEKLKALTAQISAAELGLKDLELENQRLSSLRTTLADLEASKSQWFEKLIAGRTRQGELEAALELRLRESSKLKLDKAVIEKQSSANLSLIQAARGKLNYLLEEQSSSRFEGLEQKLATVEEKETNIFGTKESLAQQINDLKVKLGEWDRLNIDARGRKRTLQDNVKLLELRELLQEVKDSIAELEETNVDELLAEVETKLRKERAELDKYNEAKSSLSGEIKQLKERVMSQQTTLDEEYDGIDERYKEAAVLLESTIGATNDLTTYAKALDAAILQFHSLKMQEINSILDELWKRTYTGTDIDTISIKSECDKGTTARTMYNYRVCMYKQDTELDMRGRCSAGQKVLASVIIRLALSECFGTNCGILVLDEPTTNLDSNNIVSLAKSLSNIIEHRREQRNFQLIVITHDESFLAAMNAAQFTDHFNRISRDARQISRISRHPISELVGKF